MDASIYTEKLVKPSRPAKTPKSKVREQRYQAKLQKEKDRATQRLYPILYRKGKVKGQLVVMLSESSLDRLAHDGTALTPAERTLELFTELYKYLDGHGLVNHRVVKDGQARLELIEQIVAHALDNGEIEKITRVSKLTIELSSAQMRIQQAAAAAHQIRLEEQRASKKDGVLARG